MHCCIVSFNLRWHGGVGGIGGSDIGQSLSLRDLPECLGFWNTAGSRLLWSWARLDFEEITIQVMLWSVELCVSSNDWSSLHENIQKRPFPTRLPPINNLSKQSSAAGLRACVVSSCMELGVLDLRIVSTRIWARRAFPLTSCVTRSHCGRNFSPKKPLFLAWNDPPAWQAAAVVVDRSYESWGN